MVKAECLKSLAWLTAVAGTLLFSATGHCLVDGDVGASLGGLVLGIAHFFVFGLILDQYAKAKSELEAAKAETPESRRKEVA